MGVRGQWDAAATGQYLQYVNRYPLMHICRSDITKSIQVPLSVPVKYAQNILSKKTQNNQVANHPRGLKD